MKALSLANSRNDGAIDTDEFAGDEASITG